MDVHPTAALFPMMADDELADLAADIKANGLFHSIILDPTGEMVVDGRNRLAACKLAGVEPAFVRLDGEDPKAVIVSANLARRNLTKAQKAMATAMIYPDDGGSGGRGKKDAAKNLLESGKFGRELLRQARAVRGHSLAKAQAVMAGVLKLDEAFADVQAEQKARESDENKISRLRAEAPDLAELVDDERLSVAEAFSAYEEREKKAAALEASRRETVLRLSEYGYRGAIAWSVAAFAADSDELVADKEFRAAFLARLRVDPSELPGMQRGARRLAGIIAAIIKKENEQ
jgi:hypothetical protein